MRHKNTIYLKTIASVLVVTFSYTQILYAADVRQMLIDAKNFFLEEDAKRPRGYTAEDLEAAQAQQQAVVDQQQALEDFQNTHFSLKTSNGDVLKYVGDKLSEVERPDGTKLANIVTDAAGVIQNADLSLVDGSVQIYQAGKIVGYMTPDGQQVIYTNGEISKVISKAGVETLYSYTKDAAGKITQTTLDNITHTALYDANGKIKEVTRKSDLQKIFYTNGMISRIVNSDGSQVLFTATVANGDTTMTPQGGDVSKIVLADGSTLDSITWDANNKVDSATITEADGSKYIYQLKLLTRSYDVAGIVTNYTTTAAGITAVKAGETTEYLLDKTAVSFTDLLGNKKFFVQSGTYKGLVEKETLSSGVTYFYEYAGSATAPTVTRREAVSTLYAINTLDGQTVNAQSTNPKLNFDFTIPADGTIDQAVVAQATATGKTLKLNLVAGTGSTYVWNGVTTSLGVTLAKGTTYKAELRWETGRVGIYVYGASAQRPATPTASITDRAWDPKFKVVATNAKIAYDWTLNSGYFNQNFDMREKNYANVSGSPVMKFDFKQKSTSYKTMNIKVTQSASGGITRTLTFYYDNAGIWYNKISDYNSSTGVTTNTTVQYSQVFTNGTEYTAELRHEGTKMNLYVYAKGAARPATPIASLNAFNVSEKIEMNLVSFEGSGVMLKNSTAQTYSAAAHASKPATARLDTVKNLTLTKPAGTGTGVNSTDFSSITYDALANLKQVNFKDGSKLIFDKGVLKQSLDATGKSTTFNFEQSGLSNITGSSIIQSNLTTKYAADGKISELKVGDLTVHYWTDGTTVDWIEKADGTELYGLTFNTSGQLTDATIITPDGEERKYVATKLVQVRRADQSQLFYAADKVTKMITPEKITYNFVHSTSKIEALLDTTIVPAPDALTPVKMEYDTSFNLTKVTRQNQEIINYTNNQVSQILIPNKAAQVFNYTKDAAGKVISYTVTQGNVVTTYDANNQPVSSKINPTADNPHTFDVTYQYGKMRTVKKNGVQVFAYSYNFDASGTEITQVDDSETNTTKLYKGSDLQSSLDKNNSVLTSYKYDANSKVSEVKVTRFDRLLHTYTYSYPAGGTDTVVTDELGVKRTYDSAQKLKFLEKDGQKFGYTYTAAVPGGTTGTTQQTVLPVTTLATSNRSTSTLSYMTWNANTTENSLSVGSSGTWVEYAVTVGQSGDLKIEFDTTQHSGSVPADYQFRLEFSVDGVMKTTHSTPLGTGWKANSLTLTGLTAGNHVIRLKWINDLYVAGQYDANFKFRNMKMTHQYLVATPSQPEIVEEALLEKKLSDGSVAKYAAGKVSEIQFTDGRIIKDIVLASNGAVSKARYFSSSSDAVGMVFEFDADGLISKYTTATGIDHHYRYEKDTSGVVTTVWVKKGAVEMKYDGTDALVGMSINGILNPNDINLNADHTYSNGFGPYSIDGDMTSMQYHSAPHGSGGGGDVSSTHVFDQPQVLTSVKFKMYAFGRAAGSYNKDYEAYHYVEVFRNNAWERVSGSFIGTNKIFGEGSYTADVGEMTLNGLNLNNVTAVRAVAHGFGNSSDNSNASGAAGIYEIQWALADSSYLTLTTQKNTSNQVTGYTLTGANGVLRFDALGAVTQANSALSSVQQEMAGQIQKYTFLQMKNRFFDPLREVMAASNAVTIQEYAADGTLETQTHQDGSVTLFENNKPSQVLDKDGRIAVQYSYDASGNPTRVYLKHARDSLPDEVIKAKQDIEAQRVQALRDLATQSNIAYQSIRDQYAAARTQAQYDLDQSQNQYNSVSSQSAKGKAAKQAKAANMNVLADQINAQRANMTQLLNQEADSMAGLNAQLKTLSDQIEADTVKAVSDLSVQEANAKKEILRQETSPIIFDHYRRLLGRDPDTAEYNFWIGKIDYNSGATLAEHKTVDGILFTTALKNHINALPELSERTTYVNTIKTNVLSAVDSYLAMTQAQKEAYAATLGVAVSDLVPLSTSDATKIKSWINTRSLHFGQSAFLALENLLEQKGKSFTRTELAKQSIMIDILSGVISPLDDGDLVLSVFSLNKVAKLYGVDLVGANVSWDDLKAIIPATGTATSPRVIAHINGNHFVVVKSMTATTITYIDMGKGKDKSNESVTLSKADFLKVFQGNITLNQADLNQIQTVRGASAQTRVLTVAETKNIRGAFLPLLVAAIVGALSSIGGALAAVGAWITTTLLPSIGGLVANVIKGLGAVLNGFGKALSYVGKGLYNAIKFAASTIGNVFGNPLATSSSQNLLGGLTKATFGDALFQTAVKFGFSVATSKGLEALGVNPAIANLAAAFVTGGITSSFDAGYKAANFIQGGVKALALQGSQTVLQNAGVDTTLSQTLLTIASPFIDGIQTGNIGGATVNIIKDLPKNLTNFGLQKAGQSLGLSSTVAQLVAAPLTVSLGTGFKDGALFGQNLIQGIQQSAALGAVAYGLEFAGQAHPVLGSLLSQDIIKGAALVIGKSGIFDKIFNTLGQTALNVFNVVGGSIQSVFGGITSFAQEIQQKGLASALQDNIQSFFGRTGQEAVMAKGGAQIIASLPRASITLANGQAGKEGIIDSNHSLYFDANDNLVGKKEMNNTQIGVFGKDAAKGKIALTSGTVYAKIDGLDIVADIQNGEAMLVRGYNEQGQEAFKVDPKELGQSIKIEGPSNSDVSPRFWDSVIDLVSFGSQITFAHGTAHAAEIQINTPSSSAGQLVDIALLNGVRVIEQLKTWIPDGKEPEYFEPGNPYRSKLNTLGVQDSAIKAIPLFESLNDLVYMVDNFFKFLRDNKVVREIKEAFKAIWKKQVSKPFVPVAYSGAGGFTLNSLSDSETAGYGIKTLVLVGAPITEEQTRVKSPSLDRIVNVYGSDDIFKDAAIDPVVPGVRKIFTSSTKSFETINIELKGINHIEYFYEKTGTSTPEQRKASDFMARLSQAAEDPLRLEGFLQQYAGVVSSATSVYLNGFEQKSRTYFVDIANLVGL